jgi:hypothetical protein
LPAEHIKQNRLKTLVAYYDLAAARSQCWIKGTPRLPKRGTLVDGSEDHAFGISAENE